MNINQLYTIIACRKNTVFIILTLVLTIVVVISLLIPKKYLAVATIMVNQRSVDPITGLSLPIQTMPGYMATQLEVIGSHNVARKVVEKLALHQRQDVLKAFENSASKSDIIDWHADSLLKELEIKPSRESSLIQIGFFAKEAETAAAIANAFVDGYIQTSIEMRAQPAKLSADWFDSQMVSLRERMEQAQSALSEYQQRHGVLIDLVSSDEKLDIENSRLADLSKQLIENQAHTNELQSRSDLIRTNLSSRSDNNSLNEVLNNPLIQSLKADLARKEASFAESSKSINRNHPHFQQAEAEIHSLQQEIQIQSKMVMNSISSSLTSSKQRDLTLSEAFAEQKDKVLELKKQYDEIAILKRDVENQQKAYDAAMQRLMQNRLESEVNHTNISILNPAIASDNPAKPKMMMNLVLAVFFGSILGIGTALCREWVDRRIHSIADVTDSIGLPVLGIISRKTDDIKFSDRLPPFIRNTSLNPKQTG